MYSQCSLGDEHTVAVADDGTVYSFGTNQRGQLGLGKSNQENALLPTVVPKLPKIKMVSCGERFTVCVDYDGCLWSFGDNEHGQLGLKNKNNRKSPHKIEVNMPMVRSISCGSAHTLVLTEDTNLWSFGHNRNGQLFLQNTVEQTIEIPQLTLFSNILNISATHDHSMFQNLKGEIFECGQIGNNMYTQVHAAIIPNQPLNIYQFFGGKGGLVFLDGDGSIFFAPKRTTKEKDKERDDLFIKIPDIPPMQTISVISESFYLLDYDGNVWSFGSNRYGELGHCDTNSRNIPQKVESLKNITHLSRGHGRHFLAKDSKDGKIFVVGKNSGRLGTGDEEDSLVPKELSAEYSFIWGHMVGTTRAKSARK